MHYKFVIREILHSKGQAWIFILCVALSLVNVVSINSFRRDVYTSLQGDARKLHGGDIIVRSHHPFSPTLSKQLENNLVREGVSGSRSWEFYSVARDPGGLKSVLSNIKAVDSHYPLYGQVKLKSNGQLQSVLGPGRVVVAANLLERLDLAVGDKLALGTTSLEIVDVVISESQRPVNFVDFGPRILLSSDDLAATRLVQQGSRVHHEYLLKLDNPDEIEELVGKLNDIALPGHENVSTFSTAESRIKRIFDNLFFFLSLISIFTLLLAGIGMQSGLSALLRRKEKSIAVLRSFGATGSFLKKHYISMTLLLCLVGCSMGVAGGLFVKQSFTVLFSGFLPANITLGITLLDIVEGFALGLLVAGFFTFIPLSSILEIKPAAIFRQDNRPSVRGTSNFTLILCGALLFFALLVRQLDDIKIGLYFLGTSLGLVVLMGGVVSIFLLLLQKIVITNIFRDVASLTLRQAIKSLFRPGNATRSIVVTLALAISVLLSIELVEHDLNSTYIQSYPEDAPTLFCLDIQKNQKQPFLALTGNEGELFPVVRARLMSINGKKIDRQKERKRRGDSLSREFNLSYRASLLEDEIISEGKTMFATELADHSSGMVAVSVLDSIAQIGKMKTGDILLFNIQGVPLKAYISSIRSRTKSMLYPFFYFVFPPEVLQAAPQTYFAALRVDKNQIAQWENKIVNEFPNISTINVSATAEEMGRLMVKVTRIIDFFALFSILAGGLILVSSILATRIARAQEGVYYKILGAKSGFVFMVFLYENVILALSSAFFAIVTAQAISWGLSQFLFEISHEWNWDACVLTVLLAVVFVVSLGLLSSYNIVKQKPAKFLRDQP